MTRTLLVCPACAAPPPPPLVRFDAPILLNVLERERARALAAPRSTIWLAACPRCGLIWNTAFFHVDYDARYHVDPSGSPRHAAHLDAVADRVAALLPPGGVLLELGSGQGDFLRRVAARAPHLGAAFGFDPAFRGDQPLPPGVHITPTRWDGAPLPRRADLVLSRHTIEHLADPNAFLAPLAALPGAPQLVLETPDAGWTMSRGLLHDFCYEHCTLFTADALGAALHRAGFHDIAVEPALGGEYLLAIARAGRGAAPPPSADHVAAPATLAALGDRFVPAHRSQLERDAIRGPVAVWGAAGKGALFLQLVDPQAELVCGVVDIDPRKLGTFLPGAGHAVLTPAEAAARGVRTVVAANPSYGAEIVSQARSVGLEARLWCVGAPGVEVA